MSSGRQNIASHLFCYLRILVVTAKAKKNPAQKIGDANSVTKASNKGNMSEFNSLVGHFLL